MRRSLVVGNWKMNGTRDTIRKLLAEIRAGLGAENKTQIGVCAPFVYIPEVADQLKGSQIMLGAQNIGDQIAGAYTGEISPAMLLEFSCKLAIVGHSERRMVYGESDQLVAARYANALKAGIVPILCIGETLEEREAGKTFDVVKTQLKAVLDSSGVGSLEKAVIAYEPVWAIGTGKTASTEQAQEVHAFIRGEISQQDPKVANAVQILYGGSVKADNAPALFARPDIDGGLIGGASLDAAAFVAICKSA